MTLQPSNSTTSEIKPLTALRMFAALLVFFHHYNNIDSSNANYLTSRFIVEGHIGVNLFFVLSGFLIALRYTAEIRTGYFSFYRYWIKRIARIWPLYFFILVLTLMVRPAPVPLVNFTFAQGYFDSLKFTGIPTAWSLTVEETFYLLAPLLFWIALWRKAPLSLVGLRLVLVSLVVFAVGLALTQPGRSYGLMANPEQVNGYTIFGRLFDFAAGIFAANLYQRTGAPRTSLSYGLAVVGIAGIFVLALGISFANDETIAWVFNPPLAICMAALIFSLTAASSFSRALSNRLLVYGGRISYALYLIQLNPLLLGIRITLLPTLDPVILYFLFNVVSAGLYEMIERPAQKLLVSRLISRRTTAPSVLYEGA